MEHIHYYFNSIESKYNQFKQSLPGIIYTGIVTNAKNWLSEPNFHTFYEILYFYKGYGKIYTNGAAYDVSPGDLVVYQPGVVHMEKSDDENPFKFAFLSFNKWGDDPSFALFTNSSPVTHTGLYRLTIENIFTQIITESRNHLEGYEIICDNLLVSFIILYERIFNAKFDDTRYTDSQKIKQIIDSNYDQDLSLDDLSEMVYVSKHHLAHVFKNEIGIPPITYLINKRMDEAKRLLAETDMSINEISSIIGYENQNYFSQLFKRTVGQAPANFRQSTKK